MSCDKIEVYLVPTAESAEFPALDSLGGEVGDVTLVSVPVTEVMLVSTVVRVVHIIVTW